MELLSGTFIKEQVQKYIESVKNLDHSAAPGQLSQDETDALLHSVEGGLSHDEFDSNDGSLSDTEIIGELKSPDDDVPAMAGTDSLTKEEREALLTGTDDILALGDEHIQEYDIFLSHSYADKNKIFDLKVFLNNILNFSIYIDWLDDTHLDRYNITAKTARVLRDKMRKSKCLIFVTSLNHPQSKWMPWELGFFDGLKGKTAILPISLDNSETNVYNGQEYLGLYPYLTFDKKSLTFNINNSINEHCPFKEWLKADSPYLQYRNQ